MVTFGVFGKAFGKDNRSVNCPDHFKRGNELRIAREPVTAICAVLGYQQLALGQLLQDF
jgi:hypothetical protein